MRVGVRDNTGRHLVSPQYSACPLSLAVYTACITTAWWLAVLLGGVLYCWWLSVLLGGFLCTLHLKGRINPSSHYACVHHRDS